MKQMWNKWVFPFCGVENIFNILTKNILSITSIIVGILPDFTGLFYIAGLLYHIADYLFDMSADKVCLWWKKDSIYNYGRYRMTWALQIL